MSEDAVVVERDLERQQGMCQSLQSQLNQLETETTQSLVNKTQVIITSSLCRWINYGVCVPRGWLSYTQSRQNTSS